MGILDSIVGGGAGTVEKQAAGAEEGFLASTRDEILGSKGFREAGGLRQAGIRSLKFGRPGERAAQQGTAAADVGQAFPGGGDKRGAFERATNRAKALTRLGGATNRDFDSQLLRDRLTQVGGGLQRQAAGRSQVQGALGIRDRVAGASKDAQERAKAARSNIAGSIAGAALSFVPGGQILGGLAKGFQGRKQKRKTQQGFQKALATGAGGATATGATRGFA